MTRKAFIIGRNIVLSAVPRKDVLGGIVIKCRDTYYWRKTNPGMPPVFKYNIIAGQEKYLLPKHLSVLSILSIEIL